MHATGPRLNTSLPTAVFVGIAALGAFLGVSWDIATHIDLGRDSFWSPPHLMIYGSLGFGIVGAMIASLIEERRGTTPSQPVLKMPLGRDLTAGMLLSVVAVGLVLGAAPVDEWWHSIFGLDVTLWSPPHLIAIFAGFTAAWGISVTLIDQLNQIDPDRMRPGLRPLRDAPPTLWAFLIGTGFYATGLLLVLGEYDFDVPQFGLRWHAPVLVGISALLLALARRASDRRWSATVVAGVITVERILAVALLAALGRSLDHAPLLIVPALAVDLLDRSGERRRSPAVTGLVFATLTVAVEAVWMRVAGPLVWHQTELLEGGALALVAGAVAWTVGDRAGALLRPVRGAEPGATSGMARTAAAVGATAILAGALLAGPASQPAAAGETEPELAVELSRAPEVDRPFDLRVALPEGAEEPRLELWRAEHRVERTLVRDGSSYVARDLRLEASGGWAVFVRYRAGGVDKLADGGVDVPGDERRLSLVVQTEQLREEGMPSWAPAVAWTIVSLMTAALVAILAVSFRLVRRNALSVT